MRARSLLRVRVRLRLRVRVRVRVHPRFFSQKMITLPAPPVCCRIWKKRCSLLASSHCSKRWSTLSWVGVGSGSGSVFVFGSGLGLGPGLGLGLGMGLG